MQFEFGTPADTDHHPTTLWSVLWNDRSLSVLAAPTRDGAESMARSCRGDRDDRWPARDVEPFIVRPLDFLELGVSSPIHDNEPGVGRIDVAGKTLCWKGTEIAARFRHPGATAAWIARCARSPLAPSYRLWAHVGPNDGLTLFTAIDFASALRWARESGPGWAEHEDIEPVEDLLVQLKPCESGYVPTCYRVWIEGFKVGWPRPPVQMPPGPEGTPPSPLPAEARLPIPVYSRSCAYGPAREREDRRRLDQRG